MKLYLFIFTALVKLINLQASLIEDKNYTNNFLTQSEHKTLHVVIPMAGDSTIFREAGYREPKPFILLAGKKMIAWVVENVLPKKSVPNIKYFKFHFVLKKTHLDAYNVEALFKEIFPGIDFTLHPVNSPTQGATCTVLLAKDEIDNNDPLIIVNADQFIDWNPDHFYNELVNSKHDGIILTFNQPNSEDERWSFAKIDENKLVVEVQEKKWISPYAAVGLYGWKKGSDFVKYAKEQIEKEQRVRNQFYLCPVYNEAILDKKKIGIEICHRMWSLGYPSDLEEFRLFLGKGF